MRKVKVHQNCIISVDPGTEQSGLAVICENSLSGLVIENSLITSEVRKYSICGQITVIIEDIKPYRHRFSLQIIDTCKFIGELNYRLRNELGVNVEYVSRGEVKKWVFGAFPGLCEDRIRGRIQYLDDYGAKNEKKRYRNKDGTLRKPSFHWVDDRVVIAAMKELWRIPTPKPGKRNICGFSGHSWQALAAGSCFLVNKLGINLIEEV